MNADEEVTRQIAHVRRLLQQLANPHRAVHFITDDVDAHVALLDPALSVLDPTPFAGLVATQQERPIGHPRRPPPSTSSVHGPPAEPGRRTQFTQPAAPSARSSHVGERLTASADSGALRVNEAIRPVQRLATHGALPVVTAAETAHERQVSRESGSGLDVRVDHADVAAHELPPPVTAQSELPAWVDFEALVHRVLRRRRSRQSVRQLARRSEPGGSPTQALRASAHTARRTPDLTATSTPVAQRLGLPVSPRSPHSATAPLEALPQDHGVGAEESDSFRPHLPARAPLSMAPSPSPMRSGHSAFFFDPFEPREPVDIGEHTLTDRINQALREQARRQGVDLT